MSQGTIIEIVHQHNVRPRNRVGKTLPTWSRTCRLLFSPSPTIVHSVAASGRVLIAANPLPFSPPCCTPALKLVDYTPHTRPASSLASSLASPSEAPIYLLFHHPCHLSVPADPVFCFPCPSRSTPVYGGWLQNLEAH